PAMLVVLQLAPRCSARAMLRSPLVRPAVPGPGDDRAPQRASFLSRFGSHPNVTSRERRLTATKGHVATELRRSVNDTLFIGETIGVCFDRMVRRFDREMR